MNSTVEPSSPPGLAVDDPVKIVTAIFGFIVLLINLIVLVYLLRILVTTMKKKDNCNLLIHLISVAVNDTLCGVTVFLIAVIYVNNQLSIYVCAYTMFFTLAFQNASQGNITCISVQRYVCSRNVHTLGQSWQTTYTKCMLTVNIIIAFVSLGYCLSQLNIRKTVRFDNGCNYYNISDGNILSVITAFFVVGIPFTVLSDILCFLTMHRLRARVRTTIEPIPSSNTTDTVQTEEGDLVRTNYNVWQQKAIMTISLIIVSFNFSFLPSVLTLILKVSGVYISADTQRVVFMSLSMNSLFNPFIIASRTNTMRSLIRRDVQKLSRLWYS